jgi:hypothetical protein
LKIFIMSAENDMVSKTFCQLHNYNKFIFHSHLLGEIFHLLLS